MDSAWSAVILKISYLIGAIIVIYKSAKWGVNKMFKLVQTMAGTHQIQDRQVKIEEKLDLIIKELSYNGGGSTKDFLKDVQSAIIRVESRQQALLDMPDRQDGLFECNKQGDLVWTNKSLCIMLGKTPDDLLGTGWYNSIHRNEKFDVIEEWESCMSQKRDFIMDVKFQVSSTQQKTLGVRTSKMVNNENEIIGWFGSLNEIE